RYGFIPGKVLAIGIFSRCPRPCPSEVAHKSNAIQSRAHLPVIHFFAVGPQVFSSESPHWRAVLVFGNGSTMIKSMTDFSRLIASLPKFSSIFSGSDRSCP